MFIRAVYVAQPYRVFGVSLDLTAGWLAVAHFLAHLALEGALYCGFRAGVTCRVWSRGSLCVFLPPCSAHFHFVVLSLLDIPLQYSVRWQTPSHSVHFRGFLPAILFLQKLHFRFLGLLVLELSRTIWGDVRLFQYHCTPLSYVTLLHTFHISRVLFLFHVRRYSCDTAFQYSVDFQVRLEYPREVRFHCPDDCDSPIQGVSSSS